MLIGGPSVWSFLPQKSHETRGYRQPGLLRTSQNVAQSSQFLGKIFFGTKVPGKLARVRFCRRRERSRLRRPVYIDEYWTDIISTLLYLQPYALRSMNTLAGVSTSVAEYAIRTMKNGIVEILYYLNLINAWNEEF